MSAAKRRIGDTESWTSRCIRFAAALTMGAEPDSPFGKRRIAPDFGGQWRRVRRRRAGRTGGGRSAAECCAAEESPRLLLAAFERSGLDRGGMSRRCHPNTTKSLFADQRRGSLSPRSGRVRVPRLRPRRRAVPRCGPTCRRPASDTDCGRAARRGLLPPAGTARRVPRRPAGTRAAAPR